MARTLAAPDTENPAVGRRRGAVRCAGPGQAAELLDELLVPELDFFVSEDDEEDEEDDDEEDAEESDDEVDDFEDDAGELLDEEPRLSLR
jgi:hypothetical protein